MMVPYAHPQHMKLVKHLVYVWYGCEMSSGWVASLKHCILVLYRGQLVTQDLSWLPKSELANVMATGWWWFHMPIHSLWSMSNTLHMFDMDVRWVLVGLKASNTVYFDILHMDVCKTYIIADRVDQAFGCQLDFRVTPDSPWRTNDNDLCWLRM